MSKTLQNILTTFSKMEALPKKPFVSCGFLQLLFKNLDNFDTAQRKYFCDEKAGRIFDWVLQNNLLMTLYENPAPEILDNIPYPKNVWDSITQKALNMPPVVAEDYLLDRINTWLLESYAVKGRCEAKPGDIVLDCGTYTGNTSVYFSQKVGTSGHVYGFEPGPATFKIYSENVAPYNNITPINAGLTDKSKIIDGFTTMGFSGDHPGAAFSTAGEVQVPVTAIDIFCGERKIPRVDFIKMDVEGAESDVLQGAAATMGHRGGF